MNILDFFVDLKKMIFWKITSCNFQSRWPIMTLGGVYSAKRGGGRRKVSILEKIRNHNETHAHYIFCVWEMFGNIIETHAHVVGVVAR